MKIGSPSAFVILGLTLHMLIVGDKIGIWITSLAPM